MAKTSQIQQAIAQLESDKAMIDVLIAKLKSIQTKAPARRPSIVAKAQAG